MSQLPLTSSSYFEELNGTSKAALAIRELGRISKERPFAIAPGAVGQRGFGGETASKHHERAHYTIFLLSGRLYRAPPIGYDSKPGEIRGVLRKPDKSELVPEADEEAAFPMLNPITEITRTMRGGAAGRYGVAGVQAGFSMIETMAIQANILAARANVHISEPQVASHTNGAGVLDSEALRKVAEDVFRQFSDGSRGSDAGGPLDDASRADTLEKLRGFLRLPSNGGVDGGAAGSVQ